MDIILLPVVGAIAYTDSNGHSSLIEAGQVQVNTLPKGATIEIANPYENDLINFIQLWMRKEEIAENSGGLFSFDLEKNKNSLVALFPSNFTPAFPKMFMGKFAGRSEAKYNITNPGNGLFVFVIEGAFEVHYRLLEERDGLTLWNVQEIELEALSNDAIILLVEMAVNEEVTN